eukprot:Skav235530  [mRNA]  locus=scaffold3067:57526:58017:- [translate_table: standard]
MFVPSVGIVGLGLGHISKPSGSPIVIPLAKAAGSFGSGLPLSSFLLSLSILRKLLKPGLLSISPCCCILLFPLNFRLELLLFQGSSFFHLLESALVLQAPGFSTSFSFFEAFFKALVMRGTVFGIGIQANRSGSSGRSGRTGISLSSWRTVLPQGPQHLGLLL